MYIISTNVNFICFKEKKMRTKPSLIIAHWLGIAMLLQACGLPAIGASPTATQPPLALTQPPAQPAVVHSVIPSTGTDQVSSAHDNEESTTFADKSVRGGDEFRINRFERPFTAGDMTYLPYIDIVDIGMSKDTNFYYVQIKLAGVDPDTKGVKGYYGVEFDLNKDGKTETLVLAKAPTGPDWTTDGVQVFVDSNGDIGGLSSKPDAVYAGNGYETKVFDSGNGSDPDLAWARFINNSSPVVEIAFKKSALKDIPNFMFSVLASGNQVDPTKMYYNDTISEQNAGSPIKGNKYYPLKELSAYDNTCRLPAGFQPDGTEPYGCSVGGPNGDIQFVPGKVSFCWWCVNFGPLPVKQIP
jgi:hypothetical protein